jgi:hypothetical protein
VYWKKHNEKKHQTNKPEKYSFDEESFCNSFGDKLLNYLPSNPEITPFFGEAHVVVDKVEDVLEYLTLDFESFLKSREQD